MSFDLQGQTAIVTGAARGIGRGISKRLSELGVQVSGWDLDDAALGKVTALTHRATADVTDLASVEAALQSTLSALGQVDILINNAGINGPVKPAWEYSLEQWQQVLAVDLTGVFICCKALIPHMRSRRYGRLITVASIAGKEGNPGASPYGAAKAGVIGLAKGLARELASDQITVNCIAPAITETELFAEMTDDYIAEKKAKIPLGRFCSIEEIADTVAWVASPRCSFTTGAVFDVSGGRATY